MHEWHTLLLVHHVHEVHHIIFFFHLEAKKIIDVKNMIECFSDVLDWKESKHDTIFEYHV